MSGRHPPISPSRAQLNRRAVLLAAGTGALVSACSTASGQPAGKVAVHGDNTSFAEPLSAAGAAMKKVAGLSLVSEVIPSAESFEQVVKSSLRTNRTPDLLKYWSGYRLKDLARTGGIVDLSAVWKRCAARGWVDPALRGAFTHRGRVYGLPMNLAHWVIYYNPRVFKENGLTKPRTWDDFLTACKTLKGAGITPLHAVISGRWPAFIWFQEMLSRQDPRFYLDLMNGRARYTDERAERAMRTISDFADNGWFTSMDVDHNTASASLVHGKLGMMPAGTWMGATITAAGGKFGENVDAFVLPMQNAGSRPSVIFESSAFASSVKGPDRKEAFKAAENWLHPEVARAFADALQDGSPNPKVPPANPVIEGVVRTVRERNFSLLNRFWELGPPELVESTVDDLAGFMLNPSSYRPVLRTMQERADEAWKVWREAEET
ncbi:extracellular solute-binding protein [Streptomyces armeniacus]|uniref:Extracellular solute-binding protein n=1 Tax=Streptomyces armeniacus TaxID=83291 RepID=A0A345XM77_9ACTN|nr:extracellular solute-binding protein [Streptomyces armeniacus]AXK32743.1 extracellular solute-binding protein [Streptomyces armeniacus]